MSQEPKTLDEFSALIKPVFDGGGRPDAILKMIWVCAVHDWKLPDWAKNAYDGCYRRAQEGYLQSWDEVFGKPFPEQHALRKQAHSRRYEVWGRVHDYSLQGHAITHDLFERVGRDLNMSGYTVTELYYEVQGVYAAAQVTAAKVES
jgi:hypothetical protein